MRFVRPFRPLKRALRQLVHARAWRLLQDDDFAGASMGRLGARVDGRSVALVGNAQALLASGAGPAIDAHQFVMRFNLGFVTRPEHQGQRTDLVGVSGSVRPEQVLAGFPGAQVFWLSGQRDMMRSAFLRRVDELALAPLAVFEALRQQLGAKPSSGLVALAIMRSLAPSSITLYGFDWKRSPSFYTHRMGPHDWAAEAALVQSWQAEDARLTIIDPSASLSPAAAR